MPTYRMYMNEAQTAWISFVTPTNATESPKVSMDDADPFHNGTATTEEYEALPMYQRIATLPDGVRPYVTDYGKWQALSLSFNPTIKFTVAVPGMGTASGTIPCKRGFDAMDKIQVALDALGVPCHKSPDGQTLYYRADPPVEFEGIPVGITTKPAGWSGPVLIS